MKKLSFIIISLIIVANLIIGIPLFSLAKYLGKTSQYSVTVYVPRTQVWTFTSNDSLTHIQEGYYYIEAWGGNGGNGGRGEQTSNTQSAGGVAVREAGLYYLTSDSSLYIYVGMAGESKPSGVTGSGSGSIGGTNGLTIAGTNYGLGAKGGDGYTYGSGLSGAGGGGGAGSFVLKGSTVSDILICSGGGAGGGGGNGALTGTVSSGGNGGSGNGGNGFSASNSGASGSTSFASIANGGNGGNGGQGTLQAPGGGGGGGGGGYNFGGNGGNGGSSGVGAGAKGGGGGKGGMNYTAFTTSNPGFTLTNNTRTPGLTNGYIVISYLGF